MVSATNRKVVRVVYRSLLRASGNGRHPEVFGTYADPVATVVGTRNGTKATALPSTAKEVRRALHDAFTRQNDGGADDPAKKNRDMFATLRRANELSSVLRPRKKCFPAAGLPVFDFGTSAAVRGEELYLRFFEPRYRKLAELATSVDGGGFFVLRARPVLDEVDCSDDSSSSSLSLSVLMKIVEHNDAGDGVISVRCIGGPRLRVLQQQEMRVDDSIKHSPCMVLATDISLDRDNDADDDQQNPLALSRSPSHAEDNTNDTIEKRNTSLTTMRAKCLDMLHSVTSREYLLSFGLPPLDPECFSFWSLRFILDNNDVVSRHKWLSCHSTFERLTFVSTLLENFQRVRRKKETEQQTGSSTNNKEKEL